MFLLFLVHVILIETCTGINSLLVVNKHIMIFLQGVGGTFSNNYMVPFEIFSNSYILSFEMFSNKYIILCSLRFSQINR